MNSSSIYGDIARRTGGDIYIGVVGPVRTGKSTFIRRFLDSVVLPNIEKDSDRERAQDQMPQSASGRLIMTTEPKFVPDEAVGVTIGGANLSVKMIDCVGYMVEGALGTEEDGVPRMVMTPWDDEPMPFAKAAEIGTSKVISEHATIGILVTTDGSIGDIPRESYVEAEARVAKELTELGKPFAILLNSAKPNSMDARHLAEELEKRYGVPVALVSCVDISPEDIEGILGLVLSEFPVKRLEFHIPKWCELLSDEHPTKAAMIDEIRTYSKRVKKLGDIEKEAGEALVVSKIDAGEGVGSVDIPISDEEFFRVLGEVTGLDVSDKKKLFSLLVEMAKVRESYNKVGEALMEVEDKGYGIVMPGVGELVLEEPRMVRTSGGWGVEIRAHAEAVHMIKTEIRADLCPMVGTEEQAESALKYLTSEYEKAPEAIWESNMFGKSLYDLVSEGLYAKLRNMPDDAREKLGTTLERIVNEGAAGLVCILI